MRQEPGVSIIINNYNYGRFLKAAIDSALDQTYHRIELIVVDDGSTDTSRELITGYGDRITPIFQQNQGQAAALNSGFARSRGDVVIFLDADDILLPETAQRVTEVFRRHPEVAKVQYRMEVIDAGGRRTGQIKPYAHLPLPAGDLRQHVLHFPHDLPWLPTSGNAFAARVLRQIFPIPEHPFRILADVYLSHLSALFGPVISLEEIGAYYRVHGSNHHEPAKSVINLGQIRQTLLHWRKTNPYIHRFAHKLGLGNLINETTEVLSVTYMAHRLVSLKLDPGNHPIEGDRIGRLFWLGVKASWRRFDVSPPMKCLFLLWFAAMAPMPRPVAEWLAVKFLYPDTRGPFNKLLSLGHSQAALK